MAIPLGEDSLKRMLQGMRRFLEYQDRANPVTSLAIPTQIAEGFYEIQFSPTECGTFEIEFYGTELGPIAGIRKLTP